MPLTKLEVVSSSTASQFFTSSQVPGDVGAADNGLHDGPRHGMSLGTIKLVNNWREQSQQAWQGKQRRLSPFSQGLLSHNCHPFVLQKKGQNSMRSQRPYLSLFVILRKGSVMALIYFVLFLQSFVLLLKSNALHESFRSKESV